MSVCNLKNWFVSLCPLLLDFSWSLECQMAARYSVSGADPSVLQCTPTQLRGRGSVWGYLT